MSLRVYVIKALIVVLAWGQFVRDTVKWHKTVTLGIVSISAGHYRALRA